MSATPLRGPRPPGNFPPGGSYEELQALVADLTRHLAANQARLRAIIENEPECVKLLDARGTLLEMNAAGLAMIEADSAESVVGQCVYGIVAPEHRDAFRGLTEQVCRGERGTLKFEVIGFQGTRRWMETHATPFFDEARGETLLLGVTRDVTERRQAERALRDAERRFHLFMENTPALAWIKDSSLRYSWVNRQTVLESGANGEFLGHDDFELWPADAAGRLRKQDEEMLKLGRPAQYLNRLVGSDGAEKTYLVVKFPLPDREGKAGVAGIGIDITERYRLAETVRELLKRLVDTQETERREVAQNLHDLIGQKLSALGINLDVLREQLPQEVALQVSPRLQQMSLLLEETIGEIREVMSELRPPALDEHGLTAALYQYASVFEARTGLRVEMSGPQQQIPLPRDVSIALFRVAQEALANAARHSGASRVTMRVQKDARRVELRVQDDGRGFRPAAAGAAAPGGWGLPAMRERVQAVRGRLDIQSAEGGTLLSVTVPLGDADPRHPG
jgi:PAS domain S-box-containing protein